MKAIILLSGGLDSATCLAIAQSQGFECRALSFRYGQRHAVELAAAAKVAAAFKIPPPTIVDIDLRTFGGSALTADIPVPKGRSEAEITAGIPVTYVPARNTIFLAYALAFAEVASAFDIFIGVNALDYSGYPDCRPDYIEAFQAMARLATRASLEGQRPLTLHTPLLHLTKGQIISRGLALGVDYGLTCSCYDPSPQGRPCGQCDACLLRAKGFAEAQAIDPLLASSSTSPSYGV